MARNARPASSGCGGSHCVARSRLARFRSPPWFSVVMQKQPPVRPRRHRAPFRRQRALCRPRPQNP